jgi:hypothetical protein
MHALCTVVAKSINNIHRFIDDRCEHGDWDYASIGGRYDRIIPVSKNTRDYYDNINFPFNDEGYAENGFPFHVIPNNTELKYVSLARVRNIKRDEVARLEEHHLINPFHPYSYILETEDGDQSQEYVVDEYGTDLLMAYINDTRHSYYYVAIIDYHF